MAMISSSANPDLAEKLRLADRKLHDILPELDKAIRCGIDVTQLKQTHELMRQSIDSLRREFFG